MGTSLIRRFFDMGYVSFELSYDGEYVYVGKRHFMTRNIPELINWLQEAYDNLEVTHGR